MRPRPEDGSRIQTLDYIRTARIRIDGSFDEYWLSRGKNLRHSVNRQRNKLARESIDTRLEIINRPHEIAAVVAEYGRLESAGWKAGRGTAIHPENAQGRFYRRVLESFAETGEGQVYCFHYNGDIVAMDLCILKQRCLIVLKTTYDERQGKTSPALLMRHDILKQAFEAGKTEVVEFYGSVMDWHRKWSEEIRTMYQINLYRWGGVAMVHKWLSQLRKKKSRRSKRSEGMPFAESRTSHRSLTMKLQIVPPLSIELLCVSA